MPKDLEIESSLDGEMGLMFLYLKSSSNQEKLNINKAYKSLNLFHKEIQNENELKEIESNISKYEKDDEFKKSIELGRKYLDNYIKYGYCDWYNWSIDNWGTKWTVKGDCNVDFDSNKNEYTITFDTAWSAPTGIIKKYSEMCDDGELDWMYYDEDYDGHIFITKENNKIMLRKEYMSFDYDQVDINI